MNENLDFNGENQIGYGKYAVTKSDGLRNDTGTAFLRLVFPLLGRISAQYFLCPL